MTSTTRPMFSGQPAMMTQRVPGLSSDIEFFLPPADVKDTPDGSKR